MSQPHLSEISRHLLSSLEEYELVALLKRISSGFTSDRTRIGEYVSQRDLVSAYCSYYLPTNIPKLNFLLNQLPKTIVAEMGKLPLIDIGSGPGTYSVGWLTHFSQAPAIHLVDQSTLMLEQAKKLIDGLGLAPTIATYSTVAPQSDPGVMLFGNSLNEMGAKHAIELVDKLGPEFVILIEPGTKQSFAEVLPLRRALIQRNLMPVYPCARPSSCPLQGVDDWCHQVLRMTHEQEIERLSQLVGLDRKVMPFIAHLYQRGGQSSQQAHFLRFLTETKFSFMWQICGQAQQGDLATFKIEIMKRDYPKELVKRLSQASVGEKFKFQIVRELETHLRVQLTEFDGEVISS